ncbi:hypothetical protein LTS18_000642, partial [Coniosporium uncinatum]
MPESSSINQDSITSGVHDDPELKAADESSKAEPEEEQSFGVAPIPASSGTGNPISLPPGEKVPESSSINTNSITSGVHDDPELKAADEASKAEPEEEQSFGVAPIPPSSGAGNPISLQRGEGVPESSSINANSITSGVHDDPELKAADQAKRAEPQEEQSFGVAPLPATTAPGNPISLAPGEKVPQSSDYTTNSVDSNVKLDRESYEKSDAYPTQTSSTQPSGNTFLSYGGGIFGLPPVTNSMIPESSLPIGGDAARAADSGYTMQSAAPESTTTALAGAVLKEPRGIPEMVVDSQRDAHVDAEASANPEA